MGRDKAALLVEGEPLWQRQLNILRETRPRELFISGPFNGPYAHSGFKVIPDRESDQGPLGGIAASLEACQSEWLLVLAVDLPKIPLRFLERMLGEVVGTGVGIVPSIEGRHLEPLVAVYPKKALALAEAHRTAGKLKLGHFVSELKREGWVRELPVSAAERDIFTNWNAPEDLLG